MPTAAGVVAHAGAQAHLGHAPDVLGAARAEVPEASSVRSALRPARPGVSLPRRPVSTRPSDMGPLCRREDRMPYVIQKFGGACFADTQRLWTVARTIVSGA